MNEILIQPSMQVPGFRLIVPVRPTYDPTLPTSRCADDYGIAKGRRLNCLERVGCTNNLTIQGAHEIASPIVVPLVRRRRLDGHGDGESAVARRSTGAVGDDHRTLTRIVAVTVP
jgi:hypothetical protein